MISRDRYDVVESHINDRSLFSHLALGLATFGLSLGVERGLQFWEDRDQVSLALLVICAFSVVLSLVFWKISRDRKQKIAAARQALFDSSRVVSDEVTYVTSEGTQTVQQAIASDAGSVPLIGLTSTGSGIG
jgi:hypothetical protein